MLTWEFELNHRPAERADGSGNLSASRAADPGAAVAELALMKPEGSSPTAVGLAYLARQEMNRSGQ